LYFLTNDIISQLESRSFHCSLPKALSAKCERKDISQRFDSDRSSKKAKKDKKEGGGVVHNQLMLVDA